jgi:putative endonuclease
LDKRRAAEVLGRNAEDDVATLWQAKGFDVLARRLRTGAGELDVVVADRDMLVFVEVKARRSMADAVYAVSPRQQARLLEAANMALATNEDWHRLCIRFDVALVCNGIIEHIEDAIRYY